MDFDLSEFSKAVDQHLAHEAAAEEASHRSGSSSASSAGAAASVLAASLDASPATMAKADPSQYGVLRTESGTSSEAMSAGSNNNNGAKGSPSKADGADAASAYGNSMSGLLAPCASSDPAFRHSRVDSRVSASSLSGLALVAAPVAPLTPSTAHSTNKVNLSGAAAPFVAPTGASAPAPAVATAAAAAVGTANATGAPDAFRDAAALSDVKAVPLRAGRVPLAAAPLAADGSGAPTPTAGIFVGQLPVVYSPADVVQLLCAVAAESGVSVYVKDVKMHPRNTCAFVDVNADAVPALTRYNRLVLCDVNTLWVTTNTQRVADLLTVADRCSNRNFSGVPRTTLVLEQSTRDPFTGRRQRPAGGAAGANNGSGNNGMMAGAHMQQQNNNNGMAFNNNGFNNNGFSNNNGGGMYGYQQQQQQQLNFGGQQQQFGGNNGNMMLMGMNGPNAFPQQQFFGNNGMQQNGMFTINNNQQAMFAFCGNVSNTNNGNNGNNSNNNMMAMGGYQQVIPMTDANGNTVMVLASSFANNGNNNNFNSFAVSSSNNNGNNNNNGMNVAPPTYGANNNAMGMNMQPFGLPQQQQQQQQIPHCSTCRVPYAAGLVAAGGASCALCFAAVPAKVIAHSCGTCHTHICLQCMKSVVEGSQ